MCVCVCVCVCVRACVCVCVYKKMGQKTETYTLNQVKAVLYMH